MSLQPIEDALLERLDALSHGLSVAHQGVEYAPASAVPYIRPEFVPGSPAPAQEIGQSAPVRENGFIRFTVLYPIVDGPGPLKQKVADLTAHFHWRQDLTSGQTVVRLRQVTQGSLISEAGWNSIAITVFWNAIRPGDAT